MKLLFPFAINFLLSASATAKLITSDDQIATAMGIVEHFTGTYSLLSQKNITMPSKEIVKTLEQDPDGEKDLLLCPGKKEDLKVSLEWSKERAKDNKKHKTFQVDDMPIDMWASSEAQSLSGFSKAQTEAACWMYLGSVDYCLYHPEPKKGITIYSGITDFEVTENTYEMKTRARSIIGAYSEMKWTLTPATGDLSLRVTYQKGGIFLGPNWNAEFECTYTTGKRQAQQEHGEKVVNLPKEREERQKNIESLFE
uniref:Uncharacterized protein n=1 Tax=Chromera velia CCMP2878 TaxID=1169474 RepID=A0A0G4HAU0_9ALVE|eukprot:Cvel_25781.t1-p1 / transcript=Cvel_25781.t1 / gene=Cvel_25781 / organism=Chromera_velia_CCMP2878 / gene_product=hypothetical protein / transcript_product=hypothetical protein / location=Cvel_scaffold2971:17614-18554(-) / protein_length=253 / sequence_SO=supercontig / SO=protein_coding / is_pseudo=false